MYSYDMADDMVIQSMVKVLSQEQWAKDQAQNESMKWLDAALHCDDNTQASTWKAALFLETNDNKQHKAGKETRLRDDHLVGCSPHLVTPP